jgi:hypothetical protein
LVASVADTAEVEKLCERWGRWLRSGADPSGSGGFNYEPPDPCNAPDFSPGYDDPTSEVMDCLIARLAVPMRRGIIARYYWENSDRVAALNLHTNKTAHQQNVGFGLRWLDGHISGITGRHVSAEEGLEGFACLVTVGSVGFYERCRRVL